MKINTPYFKTCIVLILVLFSTNLVWSQVGINTVTPSAGSILDIEDTDKGLLVPRVNITDLATIAPITGGSTESLLVYNTNTTTGKGFYFWNGTEWEGIGGTAGNDDWSLAGNAGTTPATNFLGTTDNQELRLRTNNTERLTIQADGRIRVNTPTIDPSIGVGQIYATSLSTGGNGLVGIGVNGFGGVFGNNSTGGAAFSDFGLTGGVIGTATQPFGPGGLFVNPNASGMALVGNQGPGFINTVAGAAIVGTGEFFGAVGHANQATGNGVLGLGNGLFNRVTDPRGAGISGLGTQLGVFGYATNGSAIVANEGNSAGLFILDLDGSPSTANTQGRVLLAGYDDIDPDGGGSEDTAQSYFGGYFSGGDEFTSTFAYVGLRHDTTDGTVEASTTDYKIIGTGSVSTLINDNTNTPRIMFAPEAPEIVFQDYGVGQLTNGAVRITLDETLTRNIYVDKEHPMKVFVTLEGDCNGVYVTDKSSRGFTVKELQGGTSNVAFSWQIVANRADTMDENGKVRSKHVGLRLPKGPGKPKSFKLISEKGIRKPSSK